MLSLSANETVKDVRRFNDSTTLRRHPRIQPAGRFSRYRHETQMPGELTGIFNPYCASGLNNTLRYRIHGADNVSPWKSSNHPALSG